MCNFCDSQSCSGQCKNGWPFNRPLYNPPYSTPFNQICTPVVPAPVVKPCVSCGPCSLGGCLVSITTDCVFTTTSLSCLSLSAGTNITTVLNAICTLIGNITPPLACPSWTKLTMPAGITTPDGVINEILVDGCGNISFRGNACQTFRLTNNSSTLLSLGDGNVSSGSGAFYVLPLGKRPLQIVTLPIVVTATASPGGPILGTIGRIIIDTNGNMFFNLENATNQFPGNSGTSHTITVCFSLDNIRFSTLPI